MKKLLALVLAFVMVFALCACGQKAAAPAAAPAAAEAAPAEAAPAEAPYGGQTWTIKAAVTQADNGQESAELSWLHNFEEEVEAKTQGAVQVDIYPGQQLGADAEVIQGLAGNTIEVGFFNYTVLNSVYKPTMLMSCPGVFASEEECDTILSGDWGKEFHAGLEKETGVKLIATFSNGFRCFTANEKHPLTTVESAKGVTFRTMTSEVSVKMVEALGANAVPMASGEMYTAMQNGTVDGQENPVVNILNDKTYEVQKYLVMDKHIASIAAVGCSSEFFNSLPAEIQDIIIEAANDSTAIAQEMVARINESGIDKLKGFGMEVYVPTDEELEAWHAAIAQPCMDFVRGEVGDELVDSIQAATAAYRK